MLRHGTLFNKFSDCFNTDWVFETLSQTLCIRVSFFACKYLTIDWTGRQSWFEPMRMKQVIDFPVPPTCCPNPPTDFLDRKLWSFTNLPTAMVCGQRPGMGFPTLGLRSTRPREAL